MQLGIFQIEITLTHGAFHICNGVAHHAPQSGLRLGAMHDLFYRRIHQSAVEHGRIMTAPAPFGRLSANPVLHVFNALAVPLIVE